jgi:hypothetical protein
MLLFTFLTGLPFSSEKPNEKDIFLDPNIDRFLTYET